MADFDVAIKVVLSDEGGLVENPRDSGGATKFGISLEFYRENIKPTADRFDIENLTINDAEKIYEQYFWKPNRYYMLLSQPIATKVFDLAINIGPKHANELLQKAAAANSDMKIDLDGILGIRSLFVINHCNDDLVYKALKTEAAQYYKDLVQDKPTLQPFLEGWLNRAARDV